MGFRRATILILLAAALAAAVTDYESFMRKLGEIQAEKLRPGTRVELSAPEINAYAEKEMPAGVRTPRVQLLGTGRVRGSAIVDFVKVRRAQGHPPGWLMSKLLEGERPVSVTARIQSSGGKATVNVERVEISGSVIEGGMLDFLIDNVLLNVYPDAAVNRPFELGNHVERLDVQTKSVGVVIGK